MKSVSEIFSLIRSCIKPRPVQLDVYHDVHIDYNHKAGHYRQSNEFEQREMAASSARSDRAGAIASDYYQSLAQSARVTANYWRDLYAEGCQKLKEANDKLEVFEALSKRSLCSRFLELCFPIFFKR